LFRVTLVQGINLIENISKNNCAFKHEIAYTVLTEIANIKLRKVKILVQKIKHIINTEMENSGKILALLAVSLVLNDFQLWDRILANQVKKC
jgi:hypothetical protein